MKKCCQLKSFTVAAMAALALVAGSVLPASAQTGSGTSEVIMPAVSAEQDQAVQSETLPPLQGEAQEGFEIMRVGLVATRGAAYLQARIEPFRKYLSSHMQRPVEIVAFPTAEALVLAHIAKQVDYAHYPASAFALAYASCGCVQPLVAPLPQNGSQGTYMILVVKESGQIRTLADLTGKTLILSSKKDAVPYYMGLNELRQAGLDPSIDLGEILAEDSPIDALDRLFRDEADAALVWSSSPYNQGLETAPGAVASYLAARKIRKKKKVLGEPDFITIWQSRSIPLGPHAVHKDMSKQDRAQLTTILKAMNKDDPAAYDAIERHSSAGFRAVRLDDYAPLLEIATRKP
ncbi:MAG: PhnD/SsuA/transferrin family substrate-binding protein [Cohaesibacter sp.]|jgi:ABC-type phosphate/phosphonate transport system substrate-binding protein|nr:PhnD/SsuA/transferrin family substrate-binding protein [Cohaesibacter sp.]